MPISQINFGKIDAKHELLGGTLEKKDLFLKNYILPKNLRSSIPNDFLDDDKFIVYGLKGIGKTALLNFLAIHAEKRGSEHDFLLFKSKFSEDERQQFSQAARVSLIEDNIEETTSQDYISVWKWFIYKKLSEKISKSPNTIVKDNEASHRFVNLVRSVKNSEEESSFQWSKILPSLTRGNVTLSYDPSISFDFEWNNNQSTIKFSTIVNKLEGLLENLIPAQEKYYLFFDELEINLTSKKKTRRDIHLIRDLVLAASALNEKMTEQGIPTKIIIAIRSEVLNQIDSIGRELNKIVEDFGTRIRWEVGATENIEHPLIQIIIARIRSSLPSQNESQLTDEQLWQKFFYKNLEGTPSEKYILHQTWYKPRDIVRLTNTIKEEFPESEIIGQQEIRKTRKTYSQKCWTELCEELSTRYTTEEISLIETALMSVESTFTLQDFIISLEHLKPTHKSAENHASPAKAQELIKTLYGLGIIGNTNGSIRRYSFRGDASPDFGMKFIVHQALYRALL